MWLNLSAIFRQLSHDPSVRAVILTGAGDRAFTAGLDVTAASESGPLSSSDVAHQDTARKANAVRRHILEFQSCITDVEKCEKPVIAVLHGISFGLALDMCLACDIRFSTTTTKFSVKEVDIGIAADIGTLSRLPHSVGTWSRVERVSRQEGGGRQGVRVGELDRIKVTSGCPRDERDYQLFKGQTDQ
jgi:delta(3,5)-delta(2,4)-dienoyl-CoA isomerase